MENRRGWMMAFAVVMAVLLGACSFGPESLEGRMIYLTVGDTSGTRLISVEEHEVTALELAIYGPEEELLWEEVWEPDDGTRTYAVPVEQL